MTEETAPLAGDPSPGAIVRHHLLGILGNPTPAEREQYVWTIVRIVDALEIERDGALHRWREIDRDNVEKSAALRTAAREVVASRAALRAIYADFCSFCDTEEAVHGVDSGHWWIHPDPDGEEEPNACEATRYRNIAKRYLDPRSDVTP